MAKKKKSQGELGDEQPPLKSETGRDLKQHPLIGALKGTVWIDPDLDLTQPADPDWGRLSWDDEK